MGIPAFQDVSPRYKELDERDKALATRQGELEKLIRGLQNNYLSGVDPRRESRIEALVKGNPVETDDPIKTKLDIARIQLADVIEARHVVDKERFAEKRVASRTISDSVKPKHDDLYTQIAQALLNLHRPYAELEKLHRDFRRSECIPMGLFTLDLGFLESPLDRSSVLADFFRAAKAAGYIKTLPAELR